MELMVSSGNDFFTARRRMAEAQLKRAFVEQYDELISSDRELDRAADLSLAEVAAWRERLREQYRRCVGVPMEFRDLLMERLEEVCESGSQSVDEVIAEINADQRYGSSSFFCSPALLSGSPRGRESDC